MNPYTPSPGPTLGFVSPHFTAREVACRHCLVNGMQSRGIDMLEQFRAACIEDCGFPGILVVDDAYRCSVHNSSTPNSAKNSVHVLGLAADVKFRMLGASGSYMTPSRMERIARTCQLITGIGRADHQGYIHIDSRPDATHDHPALWCYSDSGASVKYFDPPTLQPSPDRPIAA